MDFLSWNDGRGFISQIMSLTHCSLNLYLSLCYVVWHFMNQRLSFLLLAFGHLQLLEGHLLNRQYGAEEGNLFLPVLLKLFLS